MARTTCQALSQFFDKSGDADKALPRFLLNVGLVLVGLDVDSPDRGDWWLHRKSSPQGSAGTATAVVTRSAAPEVAEAEPDVIPFAPILSECAEQVKPGPRGGEQPDPNFQLW